MAKSWTTQSRPIDPQIEAGIFLICGKQVQPNVRSLCVSGDCEVRIFWFRIENLYFDAFWHAMTTFGRKTSLRLDIQPACPVVPWSIGPSTVAEDEKSPQTKSLQAFRESFEAVLRETQSS